MIDPKELKLDNLILHKGEIVPVYQIERRYKTVYRINDIDVDERVIGDTYQPVPLTPELLEACGFQKDDNDYWHLEKLSIVMPGYSGYPNGRLYFNSWFIMEPPKYLHMLMNTYFFITGTELTVNLDKVKV